jgi:polyisoprenoid-binding protein YceI
VKTRRRLLRPARWAFAAVAVAALPFVAQAALVRTGDALVQFTAVGPGGLRIVGKSGELQVSDAGPTLKLIVPLGGLKTGIELRDRHLRDKYLQVGQYPNAQLEVQRAALKQPAAGASVTAEAEGTLLLHGKSKPVRLKYTAQHEGARIKVEGGLRIDMRDFGIPVPDYMGLKVKPEVDAGARFYVSEGK